MQVRRSRAGTHSPEPSTPSSGAAAWCGSHPAATTPARVLPPCPRPQTYTKAASDETLSLNNKVSHLKQRLRAYQADAGVQEAHKDHILQVGGPRGAGAGGGGVPPPRGGGGGGGGGVRLHLPSGFSPPSQQRSRCLPAGLTMPPLRACRQAYCTGRCCLAAPAERLLLLLACPWRTRRWPPSTRWSTGRW